MKKHRVLSSIVVLIIVSIAIVMCTSHAQEKVPVMGYDYATIRWGGRDNTHVIRPGGQVEFLGNQLKNFKRPERTDDRSFYMNVVLNGMAREGWELVGMTSDEMVLRRAAARK